MVKRLTPREKQEISTCFIEGETVEFLSKKFGCTKLTVIRNLKKNLGELTYIDLVNNSKSLQKESISNLKQRVGKINLEKNNQSIDNNSNGFKVAKEFNEGYGPASSFIEIAPLNFDIENTPRKDLSTVPISEIDFPKVVYMVVNKQIELDIKLIKDYPDWAFLPNDDLNRKTIEIYSDLKIAKSICNKEQKVIKVPNTDVFRIVAPILLSRGITRIVSEEKLIAL